MEIPKTLQEAIQFFSEEQVCIDAVAMMRWPDGAECPDCRGEDKKSPYYLKTQKRWKCRSCRRQFSVKVGTIFEDSPIILQKWLPALWMVCNCKNGVSSHELHRALGVTQKTAWFMLHRLRLALRSGAVNSLPRPVTLPSGQIVNQARTPADVNGFFIGGYGSFLSQLFNRNFPNYSAGFQLNIPLRNRANQADLITDELNYRQSQIQDKQLLNSIKLNVINAQVALSQARAGLANAVEARRLQEQVLAGEKRKYELGTSNLFNVIQVQRDTTTRELAEVDARSQYVKARVALDNVLGNTLEVQNVDIGEAKNGIVTREPDMIPAVPATAAGRNR